MNAGKEEGVENAPDLAPATPEAPSAPAAAPGSPGLVDFPAMANAANVAAVIKPDQNSLEEEQAFEREVRSEIKRLVIYALRLGAVVLGVMLVVRFWHLAAPSSWRWLSDPEVQSMDKMLFSSAFGGFVFSYLKDSVFKKK